MTVCAATVFGSLTGEKMMLLSLESRTLCGGSVFKKLNDGLTKVATFVVSPFMKNRTVESWSRFECNRFYGYWLHLGWQ